MDHYGGHHGYNGQRHVLSYELEELLYDVANVLYVESELLEDEVAHLRHVIADGTEDGNVDRICRSLELAYSQSVELLLPYSGRTVPHKPPMYPSYYGKGNRLEPQTTYYIPLSVPPAFSLTTIELLQQLVHDYMVSYAVADWISITHPEKHPVWKEKLEDTRIEIGSALSHRLKGVRRTLSPF